jgi:hypothetical protein
MPAGNPASNAVKHGLSSKMYLPDHALEAISQLEIQLIDLYQPETETESHVVRELSVAYWQKQENDRIHGLAVEKEGRIASDVFESRQLLKFHQDQAQWRLFPQFGCDILARTYLGAQYFQQIWNDIANSLSADISEMTLDQAWNAALTEKSFANIQKINHDGWWIFARFLSSSLSSDHEIKDWIDRSDATASLSADQRARQQLIKAPDPDSSKQELLERARMRAGEWSVITDNLLIQHEFEKAQFSQTAVGMGLGDEKLMAASKLAHRYRASAQSLVDKLQRRLDALQKGRELERYRRIQADARESRSQQKQNDRRYSHAGFELWESDQVAKNGPIPSAFESIQRRAVYETGIAVETDLETSLMNSPQCPTVQTFVEPDQNGIQQPEVDEDDFQNWPDSDFTDPDASRARMVMSGIKVNHEAEQYCEKFMAEKIRRLRLSSKDSARSKIHREIQDGFDCN